MPCGRSSGVSCDRLAPVQRGQGVPPVGCRHPRIILSHILPNVTAPILVIASLWLGNAILIEATLSFLGVGTQPPTPSWGLMLSSTGRAWDPKLRRR